MATEAEKRSLSSSSIDESSDKRARIDEEMSGWARQLLAEVTHTKSNTNAIMLTVNDLKNDMRKVKEEVEAMDVRMQRLELKAETTDTKIATLQAENKTLQSANDKLTDDSLRDTLTIHKIPRKQGQETWDDTERILAEFLADNSTGSTNDWLGKITRTHRGRHTSNVIHCLFRNWKYAHEVKELFRQKQGKIGQVYALDKYSINTQERRYQAQARRDTERNKVPGSKLWIKYPAILMCQRPGEKGYKVIATFLTQIRLEPFDAPRLT